MTVAGRRRPSPHFPFIALADIAWQIIVFFLVAATFAKNTTMKLDLPGSSSTPNQKASATSITVLAGETQLILNEKPIQITDLTASLKKLIGDKKNEPVVFVGRDDLTFQRNCDIMFAIQKSGGLLVVSEEK